MPKYRWTLRPVCIPVAAAVVVAAAFLFQGGFGAGHAPLDRVFIIQYPGIAFVEHIPESIASHVGDFVLVVLIPFCINLLCFALCGIIVDAAIWTTGKGGRGMEVCVLPTDEPK